MCSPETTYGDVAGQMYVVQTYLEEKEAMLSSHIPTDTSSTNSSSGGVELELFPLFQALSSQGIEIIKCPRSGRPASKVFRISFVEGESDSLAPLLFYFSLSCTRVLVCSCARVLAPSIGEPLLVQAVIPNWFSLSLFL